MSVKSDGKAEWLKDMGFRVIEVEAKTIFVKTGIPEASYVINQYAGCSHACLYCYAKFMSRWKKYGEWGTWAEVKVNAPKLVEGKCVEGMVYMSSVSDPYQPIERALKLTRRVLENMDKGIYLRILTKSDLVLRDLEVFKEFRRLEVGLTVNGFEGEVKRLFEPNSPTHRARVKALEKLREEGLRTYGFISPVIPHLVDVEELVAELEGLVDFYIIEPLNVKLCGGKFLRTLQEVSPRSAQMVRELEGYMRFQETLRKKLEAMGVKGLFVRHYPKIHVCEL